MSENETNRTQAGIVQKAKDSNVAIEKAGIKADPMWDFADLSLGRSRWNQVWPYRLSLWTRDVKGGWGRDDATLPPFTLPIAPESLSISTPFAINTSVTLGGIVEEHNGAPIRTITINATTGVTPTRGAVIGRAITRNGPSLPSSIFAGTLNGVAAIASAVGQFGSGTNINTNTLVGEEVESSTGYAQFQLLQRFLESYINFKKTSAGRNSVLALELWKDQEIYFVSPMNFERRRSAASPLEYQYSISFKAWKRINPGPVANLEVHNPTKSLNELAKALNTLEAARGVLEAARKTLVGVRADINESLFNPIRECSVFLKDTLGVAFTAADLPAQIISDMKGPIAAASGIAGALSAFGGLGNRYQAAGEGLGNSARDLAQAYQNLAISSGTAQTGSGTTNDTDSSTSGLEDGNPAHKASANPDDHYEFYRTIKPSQLNLPPATIRKIEDEKKRIRLLKREDFEARRNRVKEVLADFESSIGLGNDTYNRVYGHSTPKKQIRESNENDYDTIFALNQSIVELNKLVVSSKINRTEISAIDYIAGLATGAGIAFKVPKSKFLVPFPYSHTLEQVAQLYLGTPDRWHEIAVLNGLMAPYVDETGFSLPLLTNGNQNTVTVGNIDKLHVNQPVWISSVAVARSKRRVTRIEPLGDGIFAVSVDGPSDLEQYTVAGSAVLQAFLPNTTNSQQSIFIPSDEEVLEEDFKLKSIPGVDYFDPLLRVGGVDILLTHKGDLIVTPDGDTRLAVGLTNIVQKVRLAIDTVRGSLLHHPDYGFPSLLGTSTADVSAKDLLKICKDLFRGDPTFTGVESAAILKDGPVCKITLSVGIAGTQMVVPITVEVPR